VQFRLPASFRTTRKQEPGSGGEHRDPGWLFRAWRGNPAVRRCARSYRRADHSLSRGHAILFCVARPRLREQQCCYRTESSAFSEASTLRGQSPVLDGSSGTAEAVPFQNNLLNARPNSCAPRFRAWFYFF
jgi:hypothetical protein